MLAAALAVVQQLDGSLISPKIMGSLTGKCRDLLPSFYYARMSMEEICQELGYANTDSAKSQRLKCFNKLKEAVRARLKMMGLI